MMVTWHESFVNAWQPLRGTERAVLHERMGAKIGAHSRHHWAEATLKRQCRDALPVKLSQFLLDPLKLNDDGPFLLSSAYQDGCSICLSRTEPASCLSNTNNTLKLVPPPSQSRDTMPALLQRQLQQKVLGRQLVGSAQQQKPIWRCRSCHRLAVHAAKTAEGPTVAIVGVSGAVGQEFLRVRPPLPLALLSHDMLTAPSALTHMP